MTANKQFLPIETAGLRDYALGLHEGRTRNSLFAGRGHTLTIVNTQRNNSASTLTKIGNYHEIKNYVGLCHVSVFCAYSCLRVDSHS